MHLQSCILQILLFIIDENLGRRILTTQNIPSSPAAVLQVDRNDSKIFIDKKYKVYPTAHSMSKTWRKTDTQIIHIK